MQTKNRYNLMESKEVYSLFLEIISNPGISFQDLTSITKKDKGNLSQQLKPLVKQKIVFKEGSGKKDHPLILKVSKKGFYEFVIKYGKNFEQDFNFELAKDDDFEDYISYLETSSTFEELLRAMEIKELKLQKIYLF